MSGERSDSEQVAGEADGKQSRKQQARRAGRGHRAAVWTAEPFTVYVTLTNTVRPVRTQDAAGSRGSRELNSQRRLEANRVRPSFRESESKHSG